MKSTDIARRDREIKRSQKKEAVLQRKQEKKGGLSVGDYIDLLQSKFFHDDQKIYNIKSNNEEVLQVIKEIKSELEEKNWDTVVRKAIKKTGVKQRDSAFKEVMDLFSA